MALLERLQKFLREYRKKTVALAELQNAVSGATYKDFFAGMETLLSEGWLEEIKSQGRDFSGLPRKMRITEVRFAAMGDIVRREAMEQGLSSQISVDWYCSQPARLWQRDLPYLKKLSDFIKAHGQDKLEKASLQQRSYEIFQDEKFLLANQQLLANTGISQEYLGIIDEAEPLMLAVNPASLQGRVCHHLVVENKAVFYRLQELLPYSAIATLIWGSGWRLAGNLQVLPRQIGMCEAKHICWYFGDFDYAGLQIFQSVAQIADKLPLVAVRLARPFYQAYLRHEYRPGKANQRADDRALELFLRAMQCAEQNPWEKILQQGCYYPQEALTRAELQQCMCQLGHELALMDRAFLQQENR